ncbi:MAG: RnfABCDGE type electron transport complex subunit D [Mogibacterium diversum]|jgi:electron transport complex, rnfABCDGE type, D subunit|nr:RnfABCDGE type electron transport complex subunit D [Mogibacterium diversum]MBF1359686.1 RnfABCDGE type electron transport complex subunit D [Mogibacterium diversum]
MDNKKFHNNLIVSTSPHIVTDEDTTKLMGTVLLAMLPALVASTYIFGARVLLLAAVCIVASVGFEWIYNMLAKKPQTISDLSAAVTGLLIAFNVPSSFPLWMAVIGCFVAIVVIKQLYGGIGRNFVNPAITARIFLFISFAAQMTTWPLPRMAAKTDAVTGPTPLALVAGGASKADLPSNMDMFLGFTGGSLGEVSALALLVGGLFLIWRKVISPAIPCAFLGTIFVIALAYYKGDFNMAIFHLCAGGAMLGAFFMATDYVTSPKLTRGQIVFGIGCGVITMAIRLWGNYPEGVSFSILLMNICTPLINRWSYKSYVKGGAE